MQVATDVLAVLSRAEMSGNALKIAEQLDRNMYQRTNKVLEAAGGKWNRKAQATSSTTTPSRASTRSS